MKSSAVDPKSYLGNDIYSTNENLREAYKNNEFIGISLKKVDNQASAIDTNTSMSNADKYTWKRSSKIIVSRGYEYSRIFTNNNFVINFSEMSFPIQTWGFKSSIHISHNFNASAGGGDIGGGIIESICQKNGIRIPYSESTQAAILALQGDTNELEKLYNMLKEIHREYPIEKIDEISPATMLKEIKSKDINVVKVREKFTIIYTIHKIFKMKETDRLNLIKELARYGVAESNWSGPFMKIS
jgi:hypothetical protein